MAHVTRSILRGMYSYFLSHKPPSFTRRREGADSRSKCNLKAEERRHITQEAPEARFSEPLPKVTEE